MSAKECLKLIASDVLVNLGYEKVLFYDTVAEANKRIDTLGEFKTVELISMIENRLRQYHDASRASRSHP